MMCHVLQYRVEECNDDSESEDDTFDNNDRMAKAAKRLNTILDYMRKVKSSISMVFGLVF